MKTRTSCYGRKAIHILKWKKRGKINHGHCTSTGILTTRLFSQVKQQVTNKHAWHHHHLPQDRGEVVLIHCLKEEFKSRDTGHTTRYKPLFSSKKSGSLIGIYKEIKRWDTKFLEPSSTKVMKSPKYGESKDLLMIQNIQTHLPTIEVVSWLGHAWLLLKQVY